MSFCELCIIGDQVEYLNKSNIVTERKDLRSEVKRARLCVTARSRSHAVDAQAPPTVRDHAHNKLLPSYPEVSFFFYIRTNNDQLIMTEIIFTEII